MKKAIFFFITMWILLWGQVVSNHFLGGTLFSVQWILIAVLHMGLVRGPWAAEWTGFRLDGVDGVCRAVSDYGTVFFDQ